MIWRWALIIALAFVAPAYAAPTPTEMAEKASSELKRATRKLENAQNAEDRVSALTDTIRAFEKGLLAMRKGLRAAVLRERTIRKEFEERRVQISRLLGVLQALERATTPLLLVHPEGAVGTARSGMMVSEVTPGLQVQAERLRAELDELEQIQDLQKRAETDLHTSLEGVQKARVALSTAISEREGLPKRFADDPIKVQILADNAVSMERFAEALAVIPFEDFANPPPPFETLMGTLPLPTPGKVLRMFNETDAAGLTRPGIIMSADSLALVESPIPATVRYSGPFLDYGNVIILEPDVGYLIVLAGIAVIYSEVGEIVDQGTPLGLLGGQPAGVGDFLVEATTGAQSNSGETLYIEVRQNGNPVDPQAWFKPTESK